TSINSLIQYAHAMEIPGYLDNVSQPHVYMMSPRVRTGTTDITCDREKGSSHTRQVPKPRIAVTATAQGMYRSGKALNKMSRMIQPTAMVSRYHMGPQEKMFIPK